MPTGAGVWQKPEGVGRGSELTDADVPRPHRARHGDRQDGAPGHGKRRQYVQETIKHSVDGRLWRSGHSTHCVFFLKRNAYHTYIIYAVVHYSFRTYLSPGLEIAVCLFILRAFTCRHECRGAGLHRHLRQFRLPLEAGSGHGIRQIRRYPSRSRGTLQSPVKSLTITQLPPQRTCGHALSQARVRLINRTVGGPARQ